jgi:hypothetical protein
MKRTVKAARCCWSSIAVVALGLVVFPAWRAEAQSAPMTLPQGTVISVRTIDVVDSKVVSDQEYRATVDDSVIVGDVTVLPTGTSALLRVVKVQQAGVVTGHASVGLRLVALEVNGHRVVVETGEATVNSGSQLKKTGTSAAIGGAAGALLGGLLGGRRGLKRGLKAGALVGAGAAIVTGEKVHVPAEARLSFTLTQAALIQRE